MGSPAGEEGGALWGRIEQAVAGERLSRGARRERPWPKWKDKRKKESDTGRVNLGVTTAL